MAEVYVSTLENVPILLCQCGHRRPGGMGTMDEWFRHEETHVTAEYPEVGTFTTLTSKRNPAILPPLISKIRYLS